MPVPRSGCLTINTTGRPMIAAHTISEVQLGGSTTRCRYQATIIGTEIFSSSPGCR